VDGEHRFFDHVPEQRMVRGRKDSPLAERERMRHGDVALRVVELVVFDADHDAGEAFVLSGNPFVDGSEGLRVDVRVDAAVAREQHVAQEVGAHDGRLELLERVHYVGTVPVEVEEDVGCLDCFDEVVVVVWIEFCPGVDRWPQAWLYFLLVEEDVPDVLGDTRESWSLCWRGSETGCDIFPFDD